jgi:hypothetical protein
MKKAKRNSKNAGMKPGQTNGGSFKKGDDPKRNKNGQRNAPAVAMTKSFRDVLVMIGGEALASTLDGKPISKQKIEWLGQKLWAMALGGDIAAIRELLDRMCGKSPQPLEHSGAIKTDPLTVKVIFVKDAGKPGNGNGGNGHKVK